jgi:phospholipid/cholesterol/gamma-HCH transport system permease protein
MKSSPTLETGSGAPMSTAEIKSDHKAGHGARGTYAGPGRGNGLDIPILRKIGRTVLSGMEAAGRLALFAIEAVLHCFRPPWYPRLIVRQMVDIGYYSLPVIGMTAIFTGMVLVLQTHVAVSRLNAESTIPYVVVISLTRELGPVLAGLMLAGRVGAAMAAELGTMRVTEQIDALRTLSTNPIKYLVVPRLLAAVLMLPVLVAIADIIGVFGGYLVSIYKLDFNPSIYLKNTVDFVETIDIVSGLVKAAAFGFIVALMGTYNGFFSRGGAQGVGKATTDAVVGASILILAANFIITGLFFTR